MIKRQSRTRLHAFGLVGYAELTGGLPVECIRYWKHRTIYSPSGAMQGEVRRVRLCSHRHLCDGVNLEIMWHDGLVTNDCSYDTIVDAFDRHQLIE